MVFALEGSLLFTLLVEEPAMAEPLESACLLQGKEREKETGVCLMGMFTSFPQSDFSEEESAGG